MDKKRRIFSFLLLAVFLPAFLASVLHTHQEVIPASEECFDCARQHHHSGHISAYNGTISNCVLCHFLGLPYVIGAAAIFLYPAELGKPFYSFSSKSHHAAILRNNHTRAPPVFSNI